jgi:1,4-dihydroxy-2-naphthoate octaprenyltransferase
MLGENFGKWFYFINGLLAVICCQYFWIENTRTAALLPFIYLFFHFKTGKALVTIDRGKALVGVLEQTARNVIIFGLLLAAGLCWGR